MSNTPPTLTGGEKTDPLLEIFSGEASGSVQPSRPLASPPPRFNDGIGLGANTTATTTVAAPVAVRPSPQAAEASAFNRSEMAAQIRQSFDNLVKASPIGVPLMARRTPSTGPGPSPFPPLRSPAVPSFPSSAGRLPLPPPVPSFGGFSFPRQQQQQQVQQIQQPQARTVLTPPSGGNTSHSAFIQQQQQQQQSPTLGLVGGTSGGGGNNSNNRASAVATEAPKPMDLPTSTTAAPPSRRPASAASQGTASRKTNMSGSGGKKRELASLLASSPAVHHHIGATPLPTTMPVSGGDRPPGSEDDLTFEVTRFGRPRVAPLAYWSSERIIVGTKAAGAQGIDKGSASGDLLASAGTAAKKTGVKKSRTTSAGGANGSGDRKKKNEVAVDDEILPGKRGGRTTNKATNGINTTTTAVPEEERKEEDLEREAPVVAQRGGRGRGRGRGAAAASTRGSTRGKATAVQDAVDNNEESLPAPSPGNGIASIALAAGAKASAAAAAAKKKKTTTTATEKPGDVGASPVPTNAKNTITTDDTTATPGAKTLPEVKGVPAKTLAALAATPPAQRPKRCGECISCLNPSRKQACFTMRALGANPPLSRVSHKKKQQAAASVGAGAGAGKNLPSPSPLPLPQDSEETIIEKQHQVKKKRTLTRTKRKAEASIDTNATGATGAGGGPVRRSTRQRSASVEVTVNNCEHSTLLDTATKGNASVGPPSSRITVNKTAGGVVGAVAVDPASIWTAEQVAALHRGCLEVAPNAKNFWQKVAAMVPGRSANECFNKMYEKHPTPPTKKPAGGGGGRKLLAGTIRAGSVDTTNTEATKLGGTSKQAVQNAARKIARQQRLQQRAEEVAAAGGGGGGGSGKEVLAVEPSEEQQHRDKYIDQILRKRRGRALGMALHRAPKPSTTAAASGAGASARGFRAGASGVAREVTAALAAAREDEPDRDSGEESDYYWSDAE